jgi:transposase
VALARRCWIREQGFLDPARLVFIDETAVSTNMARLWGRAARGIRVIGSVPLGSWQTITFVAALRHNKMIAPMVVEGAMNGEMFLAYVENCLVPLLRRHDIVVMDNCRIHLGSGIREAIEKSGATLRYLPKYSPDLNPIEMPYSKFKTFLRKVAARTIPALTRAIRSFIPQLGRRECANYFRHAGYGSI